MTTSAAEHSCAGPADTEALAAELAAELRPGDVLLLSGVLGAGKTCFVRGLARGLDLPEGAVLSPTFQLVRESHGGRMPLYHIDLYRLEGPREALGLGLEEYFDGDGVCAVEWPERLGPLAPQGAWRVSIEPRDDGVRLLRVARP
ncbi:MAG TPA: tRNA (adenosine(37)-N6)-threonylcarbamoyltransferase complex ATPase subunit type 1 TsaE [bacterium]|jgi:tRNA threonylcarbamoyladenosine biosynthesis protein TsaE|nr:tRNA (adenosine(37)-N6)-threonylcarbamoyltransferase complex ATPase subunit type 1 TsaE [bacterium]